MKSSELMARAEHALRTGQTENLFPVIARRALELIAEEKAANRREWVKVDPSKALPFAVEGMVDSFRGLRDAVLAGLESFAAAGRALDFSQSDFALVGPRGVTR